MSIEYYKYELNKHSFGSVEYIPEGKSPRKLSSVRGHPKNHPEFVNRIDEAMWKDYWETQVKNSELKYRGFLFEKDFIGGYWRPKKTLQELDKEIRNLIEDYDKAAKKYNKEIAGPFIKSRKKLLESIFNSK